MEGSGTGRMIRHKDKKITTWRGANRRGGTDGGGRCTLAWEGEPTEEGEPAERGGRGDSNYFSLIGWI